jgi:hypothetical protein
MRRLVLASVLASLVLASQLVGAPDPALNRQGVVISWRESGGDEFRQRLGVADDDIEDVGEYERAAALARPHPSVATMARYFDEAAAEFNVPAQLLAAIGAHETNWTQVGPGLDGGWGVMHLVRNEEVDTLGAAANLLHVPVEQLQMDARQNIRGAAALLAEYAGPDRAAMTALEEWFDACLPLSGLSESAFQAMEVRDIFRLLARGDRSPTLWGESVVVNAVQGLDLPRLEQRHSLPAMVTMPNGTIVQTVDYPGAVPRLMTACTIDYKRGRTRTVDTWVNHMVGTGTYAQNVEYFAKCPRVEKSVHFIVSTTGDITQFVRTADTAYHGGALGYPDNNPRSVGVEHAVMDSRPSDWNSLPMLRASAALARTLTTQMGIPQYRGIPGIAGHRELPGVHKTCPGAIPWNLWMTFLHGQDLRMSGWPGILPSPLKQLAPVTVYATVKNLGTRTFNGVMAAALHDSRGNFLGNIEVRTVSLAAGESKRIAFWKSQILSPPGLYQIQYKYLLPEGSNDWQPIPAESFANIVPVSIVR